MVLHNCVFIARLNALKSDYIISNCIFFFFYIIDRLPDIDNSSRVGCTRVTIGLTPFHQFFFLSIRIRLDRHAYNDLYVYTHILDGSEVYLFTKNDMRNKHYTKLQIVHHVHVCYNFKTH